MEGDEMLFNATHQFKQQSLQQQMVPSAFGVVPQSSVHPLPQPPSHPFQPTLPFQPPQQLQLPQPQPFTSLQQSSFVAPMPKHAYHQPQQSFATAAAAAPVQQHQQQQQRQQQLTNLLQQGRKSEKKEKNSLSQVGGIKLTCVICKLTFIKPEDLEIHNAAKHTRAKKPMKIFFSDLSICAFCPKTNFRNENAKLYHFIHEHSSYMQGYCYFCSYYVCDLLGKNRSRHKKIFR